MSHIQIQRHVPFKQNRTNPTVALNCAAFIIAALFSLTLSIHLTVAFKIGT